MDLLLKPHNSTLFNNEVTITGSKSESNRLLILQQFFPEISIENLSNADDTIILNDILKGKLSGVIDVHHAGTAMRFLTAFLASQKGIEVILKGSKRMHQRPIKILVDALLTIGADIQYLENYGYPPLTIIGKDLLSKPVRIPGNVSSQYITALLLIGASLPDGLELKLLGKITSLPYIKMTLSVLSSIGIKSTFKDSNIRIPHKTAIDKKVVTVESDWSSASYWYSIVALSEIGTTIKLNYFRKISFQGDAILSEIYKTFGVTTIFNEKNITIFKEKEHGQKTLVIDLNPWPDTAQTIAVTCLGLGLNCELTGLKTLKIKETDRLFALQNELQKFGSSVIVSDDALKLITKELKSSSIYIETYGDHRMAMAFAPLSLKVPLTILDAEVVSKSYPNFWKDFERIKD